MWFKNLQIYRLPKKWGIDTAQLEEQLAAMTLQPCSASDAQSIGWVPPCKGSAFAHVVNNQILLCLSAQQKLLPASVVKKYADDKAKAIEADEGRKVGRKEMRELREQMTLELLPRAFVRQSSTFGWIDPLNGWLVVDAAAPAKAEEFLELLRKSVEGLPAKLLKVTQSPSAAMTGWVAGGEAPTHFTIDQDLELRSAEKSTVRYVKHHLEGEDIRQHIACGKGVTRLAMTWGDRISFVLNENLQIKRLTFLDILKEKAEGQAENADERFDLDFTLMAGEVARLLDDVVDALGGELVQVNDDLVDQEQAMDPDEQYAAAKRVVIENGRASVSLVQRHLRIGYNAAERLLERMEQDGIVSAPDGQGVRMVLKSVEQAA